MRPAKEIVFSVIASPAGSYFEGGLSGVTLWVSGTYTRAGKGGTGTAKCGGNYAGSLAAQLEAEEHGCDQVLYLDSAGEGYLEESGTMNLCLVTADGRLITPALGTILEGVTRDTILTLAAESGLTCEERQITLDELRSGAADGTVTEVFAAGTAAVVTPIVGFKGDGYAFAIGDGEPGKQTAALRARVLGHPVRPHRGHPRLAAPGALNPGRGAGRRAAPPPRRSCPAREAHAPPGFTPRRSAAARGRHG